MPDSAREKNGRIAAPRRPGGQMASRPLHFIWLLDVSGSMEAKGKMSALNAAIRKATPAMQRVCRDYPEATVYVNAIRFGDEANWLAKRLIPISEFQWQDLEAGGLTALGSAVEMVAETLQPPLISGRALPPILMLVTDGLPTDDFSAGMKQLLGTPWGQRSVRIAIALGEDGARSEEQAILRSFSSSHFPAPLQANDAETLLGLIPWAAVFALKSTCAPAVRPSKEVSGPPAAVLPGGTDGW